MPTAVQLAPLLPETSLGSTVAPVDPKPTPDDQQTLGANQTRTSPARRESSRRTSNLDGKVRSQAKPPTNLPAVPDAPQNRTTKRKREGERVVPAPELVQNTATSASGSDQVQASQLEAQAPRATIVPLGSPYRKVVPAHFTSPGKVAAAGLAAFAEQLNQHSNQSQKRKREREDKSAPEEEHLPQQSGDDGVTEGAEEGLLQAKSSAETSPVAAATSTTMVAPLQMPAAGKETRSKKAGTNGMTLALGIQQGLSEDNSTLRANDRTAKMSITINAATKADAEAIRKLLIDKKGTSDTQWLCVQISLLYDSGEECVMNLESRHTDHIDIMEPSGASHTRKKCASSKMFIQSKNAKADIGQTQSRTFPSGTYLEVLSVPEVLPTTVTAELKFSTNITSRQHDRRNFIWKVELLGELGAGRKVQAEVEFGPFEYVARRIKQNAASKAKAVAAKKSPTTTPRAESPRTAAQKKPQQPAATQKGNETLRTQQKSWQKRPVKRSRKGGDVDALSETDEEEVPTPAALEVAPLLEGSRARRPTRKAAAAARQTFVEGIKPEELDESSQSAQKEMRSARGGKSPTARTTSPSIGGAKPGRNTPSPAARTPSPAVSDSPWSGARSNRNGRAEKEKKAKTALHRSDSSDLMSALCDVVHATIMGGQESPEKTRKSTYKDIAAHEEAAKSSALCTSNLMMEDTASKDTMPSASHDEVVRKPSGVGTNLARMDSIEALFTRKPPAEAVQPTTAPDEKEEGLSDDDATVCSGLVGLLGRVAKVEGLQTQPDVPMAAVPAQ